MQAPCRITIVSACVAKYSNQNEIRNADKTVNYLSACVYMESENATYTAEK